MLERIVRGAVSYLARRGIVVTTREQLYELTRTAQRAQEIADEFLRRAERAECLVAGYEAEAMTAIERGRGR